MQYDNTLLGNIFAIRQEEIVIRSPSSQRMIKISEAFLVPTVTQLLRMQPSNFNLLVSVKFQPDSNDQHFKMRDSIP